MIGIGEAAHTQLQADVLRRFETRLVAYLERHVPERSWRSAEDRKRLWAFVDSAERHGLKSERDVVTFVYLCGLLGGDIGELDPGFAASVSDAWADAERRMALMDARAETYVALLEQGRAR